MGNLEYNLIESEIQATEIEEEIQFWRKGNITTRSKLWTMNWLGWESYQIRDQIENDTETVEYVETKENNDGESSTTKKEKTYLSKARFKILAK